MGNLLNPFRFAAGGGGGGGPIVTDYRAHYTSTVDLSAYTFAASDFGTPSAGRYILVGIAGRGAAVRTITSVDLGGVAAAQVAVLNSGGTTVAFWIAAVPTGATGDVVYNLSGAWVRTAVGVWAITGLGSTTPFDSDTDITMVANQLAVSLDCEAGGAVFGMGANGNAGSFTWAGITERFDVGLEAGNNQFTGGSLDFAAAQTGLAVTINQVNTGSSPALLAVSLSPP